MNFIRRTCSTTRGVHCRTSPPSTRRRRASVRGVDARDRACRRAARIPARVVRARRARVDQGGRGRADTGVRRPRQHTGTWRGHRASYRRSTGSQHRTSSGKNHTNVRVPRINRLETCNSSLTARRYRTGHSARRTLLVCGRTQVRANARTCASDTVVIPSSHGGWGAPARTHLGRHRGSRVARRDPASPTPPTKGRNFSHRDAA